MNSQLPCLLGTNRSESTPQTSRLLAIGEAKKSGLILCKPFHAEFAGPGAVVKVPGEQETVRLIAIGSPEIVEVVTHEERQRAYSRRIQWTRWLQKNTDHVEPSQRIEKLFFSFEAFFGRQILASLPDEALALLVGVLPQTITALRSQHLYLGRQDSSEVTAINRSSEPPVLTVDAPTLNAFYSLSTPFVISASVLKALYQLPFSA